jgi:hypothetical protein
MKILTLVLLTFILTLTVSDQLGGSIPHHHGEGEEFLDDKEVDPVYDIEDHER